MGVVQTEAFLVFKRFLQKEEKKQLNREIHKILADPSIGEEASDELEGILIHNYEDKTGKKRLCYSYNKKVLTLLLISRISQKI